MPDSLLSGGPFVDVGVIMLLVIMLVDRLVIVLVGMLMVVYTVVVGCSPVKKDLCSQKSFVALLEVDGDMIITSINLGYTIAGP